MTRLLTLLPFLALFGYLAVQNVVVEEPKPIQPKKVVVVEDDGIPIELKNGDIIAFLNRSMAKYKAEVKGYNTVLVKQERIQGRLQPQEIVICEFRESPHSVLMKWKKGGPTFASAVLYVEGQNNNKLLAKPSVRFLPIVSRDVNGTLAQSSARYTIDKFGIKYGLERVIDTWSKRKAEGTFFAKFKGTVEVPQLNNQKCFVIHRDRFVEPEDDGVFDVVLYFDIENLQQVGSVLRNKDGELVASYFFQDMEYNPDRPDDYFSVDLLKKR